MQVVSGCIIVNDDKILMVKEAKKAFYGQWNYPGGRVNVNEKITVAAIREVYEETGCKIKLTGVLPIKEVITNKNEDYIIVYFTANLIEEDIKFDAQEILDVKWIPISELKQLKPSEIREYKETMKSLNYFENNQIFPLDIFEIH